MHDKAQQQQSPQSGYHVPLDNPEPLTLVSDRLLAEPSFSNPTTPSYVDASRPMRLRSFSDSHMHFPPALSQLQHAGATPTARLPSAYANKTSNVTYKITKISNNSDRSTPLSNTVSPKPSISVIDAPSPAAAEGDTLPETSKSQQLPKESLMTKAQSGITRVFKSWSLDLNRDQPSITDVEVPSRDILPQLRNSNAWEMNIEANSNRSSPSLDSTATKKTLYVIPEVIPPLYPASTTPSPRNRPLSAASIARQLRKVTFFRQGKNRHTLENNIPCDKESARKRNTGRDIQPLLQRAQRSQTMPSRSTSRNSNHLSQSTRNSLKAGRISSRRSLSRLSSQSMRLTPTCGKCPARVIRNAGIQTRPVEVRLTETPSWRSKSLAQIGVGFCARSICQLLLSQLGILLFLILWTFLGAVVFSNLESLQRLEHEEQLQELLEQRSDVVYELSLELRLVNDSDPVWKDTIERHLFYFESILLQAVNRGYRGKGEEVAAKKTISGFWQAWLFSVCVSTSLGFCGRVPQESSSHVFLFLFTLVGVPLTLYLAANFGLSLLALLINTLHSFQRRKSKPSKHSVSSVKLPSPPNAFLDPATLSAKPTMNGHTGRNSYDNKVIVRLNDLLLNKEREAEITITGTSETVTANGNSNSSNAPLITITNMSSDLPNSLPSNRRRSDGGSTKMTRTQIASRKGYVEEEDEGTKAVSLPFWIALLIMLAYYCLGVIIHGACNDWNMVKAVTFPILSLLLVELGSSSSSFGSDLAGIAYVLFGLPVLYMCLRICWSGMSGALHDLHRTLNVLKFSYK